MNSKNLPSSKSDQSKLRMKVFKGLMLTGIFGLVGTILSSLYLFYLSGQQLNKVHTELLPLQKSMSNLNQNANSINTELQTLLMFEDEHQNSMLIFELETRRIVKNIHELSLLTEQVASSLSLPDISRQELLEQEQKIMMFVKESNIDAAREIYFKPEFTAMSQEYLKRVLVADEIITKKISDFRIQQENRFKYGMYFLLGALFFNFLVWWRIALEFKFVKEQEELANKKLEEERFRVMQASKMASLGELSGGIAHEINNPLAIIKASSDILRMQYEAKKLDSESFNKYIAKISDTVDRISKVILSMKKFARNSEADAKENISLLTVINNSIELYSEKFRTKGIKILIFCDESIIVSCHSIEIEQVLINLASNSYDAICEFQKDGDMYIKIQVDQVDGMAMITFTDSGPGVPEEIADRIFDAFYTTKKSGAGTGLGLAISKRILLQHKGDIRIEHSKNSSRFVIEIPLAHSSNVPKSISAA